MLEWLRRFESWGSILMEVGRWNGFEDWMEALFMVRDHDVP